MEGMQRHRRRGYAAVGFSLIFLFWGFTMITEASTSVPRCVAAGDEEAMGVWGTPNPWTLDCFGLPQVECGGGGPKAF